MYVDSQEVFSTNQAVTAIGDTVSTNIYDTGNAANIGAGEDAYLDVRVNQAVTSGGAATVTAVLQTSADNVTWIDAAAGPTRTVAQMNTAGASVGKIRLPAELRRYIRVVYRTATAALTAGTFDAFIVKDEQIQQYGQSGFNA